MTLFISASMQSEDHGSVMPPGVSSGVRPLFLSQTSSVLIVGDDGVHAIGPDGGRISAAQAWRLLKTAMVYLRDHVMHPGVRQHQLHVMVANADMADGATSNLPALPTVDTVLEIVGRELGPEALRDVQEALRAHIVQGATGGRIASHELPQNQIRKPVRPSSR